MDFSDYKSKLVVPLSAGLMSKPGREELIFALKNDFFKHQSLFKLVQLFNTHYDRLFIRRSNKIKLDKERCEFLSCAATMVGEFVLIMHVAGENPVSQLNAWFAELFHCTLQDAVYY